MVVLAYFQLGIPDIYYNLIPQVQVLPYKYSHGFGRIICFECKKHAVGYKEMLTHRFGDITHHRSIAPSSFVSPIKLDPQASAMPIPKHHSIVIFQHLGLSTDYPYLPSSNVCYLPCPDYLGDVLDVLVLIPLAICISGNLKGILLDSDK